MAQREPRAGLDGMSAAKHALLEQWKRGRTQAPAATIPRRAERGEAPLSSTQERVWYLEQLVPGTPAYNFSVAFRLTGPLDVPALQRSLAEVVRRHELLRAAFPAVDGRATQVIGPPYEPVLAIEDVTDAPARAEERMRAEAQQLFPLERGPLFAARLLRLAPGEHVLQITLHHIACDGWSLGVLNRELVALYGAFTRAEPSPLPELPIQYGDVAAWQQRRRAEGAFRADLDFWRQELTGLAPLALPTDQPRPAVQRFRGARLELPLPPSLSRAIDEACKHADVTPYMFFLGAFTTLLSRYSGQDDIAVGSPIANRIPVETEPLIGYFSNTIVLRTDLSGDPSFRELLARIRQRTLAAYGHQGLPFEDLVNELAPERDTSRNPLFQVMMVVQNAPLERVPFAGLETSLEEVYTGTSKFDLWLQLMAVDGAWTATFEYNTDLWDAATVYRMARHLSTVLASAAADPDLPVSAIPLLDADERHRVLVEFNDTAVDLGPPRLLHEHVEAQVRRTPDRVAVSFEGEELTYRRLDERANRLAHRLVAASVGPDILVCVQAERSADLVVALLAVLKSGGAYVPLEPSYPEERLEHMIRDTAAPVLLTDRPLPPRLHGLAPHVLRLDDVPEDPGGEVRSPGVAMSPERLAYVIYTSGSTGLPKGAMNSHRGIGNRLLWMQEAYGLTADDRVLQKTPFSFDVSVWEFFWPLMTGATLVVARPEGHKDPTYLVETIQRERITAIHFVPSMLRVVLDHPGLADCSSLVRVVCSGEALHAEFRERFFARLPGTELHNLYGPTEAAVDVTAWQCRKDDTSPVVPIGKPIANTRIYILDRRGEPTPIGVPGELHIAGANVGRGYLRRPELDAERFLPDPFSASAGEPMYKTGDIARWLPSGDIEYLGRRDSQVKLRGMRIELGEIESVLRTHPRVADAAVIVGPDSGGERTQLVAYAVPTGEARTGPTSRRQGLFDEYMKADAPLHHTPEPLETPAARALVPELREHLRAKLPDFMIPHAFVVLDRLPVSPSGKLDRRALPPPPPAGSGDVAGDAPRTPEERVLATIWTEVLGVERVDIDGNFFTLGGDSIDSIQLVARATAAGLRVTPADVVRYPSIRQLAARVTAVAEPSGVASARPSSLPSEIRDGIEDAYPLSTYQAEMLRRKLADGPASLYVQSVVTRVRSRSGEPIDLDALAAAWQAVVDRYPVYRSAFRWEAVDEPIQIVHRPCRIAVERHDYSGLDDVHRWVESARKRGFALDQPGHVRVGLFRVGPDELVMAFLYNYMFSDGWSLSFVLADLLALLHGGGQADLAPVIPYRRYIDHQRMQDRAAIEAFWRRTMASFEVTPLVAALGGTPCTPGQGGAYRRRDAVVSAAATRALRAVARDAGLTLNHVVLAAWALVLARWTGRSRVSFGNMMTGRSADLPGYERMVGIFTSVLPMQLDVTPDTTFLDWAEQARLLQLDLDAHHHASLGDIRHWAGRPEDTDLFESCFVFLNFPFSRDGEDAMRRTELKIIEGQTQTEHPLRVAVFAFAETLDLQFFFYERQLPEQGVEQLMSAMCELLERLAGSATGPVDQVLASIRKRS
jgi:amino acid adenylation domain-containing protein